MTRDSNTRARLITEAGRTPVVVNLTSSARSAGVKTTGRFFTDDTTVLTGRGEGEDLRRDQPLNQTPQNKAATRYYGRANFDLLRKRILLRT